MFRIIWRALRDMLKAWFRRARQPEGLEEDPIGKARADVVRLRAFAINVGDHELQQNTYGICTHLSAALAEAERKPGSLPILGPLLLVTERLKSSLEVWLRLSQQGAGDLKAQQQMRATEQMFRELLPQYAELTDKIVKTNTQDLRVQVAVITGVLAPDGALPNRASIPAKA